MVEPCFVRKRTIFLVGKLLLGAHLRANKSVLRLVIDRISSLIPFRHGSGKIKGLD